GNPEIFDNDSPVRLVDALMASCALQALFPPHDVNGFQYIDGGNGSNLPLRPVIQEGGTDLVVIRSATPRGLNPWLYRDMLNIQKRAHLALMAHITSSDLARAQEISEMLSRHRRQRADLRRQVQEMVPNRRQRNRVLKALDSQPPLAHDRQPLRVRVVAPPPGARMPAVLEFDPDTSLALMRLGYLEARTVLEGRRGSRLGGREVAGRV
ncbi:MAG: patatin-like phospholipase family protein, partial [Candidatus Methylomirabilis sp.]|nr:patatin-like phospholipase family protein [Deltaproteobacteria bacterium]